MASAPPCAQLYGLVRSLNRLHYFPPPDLAVGIAAAAERLAPELDSGALGIVFALRRWHTAGLLRQRRAACATLAARVLELDARGLLADALYWKREDVRSWVRAQAQQAAQARGTLAGPGAAGAWGPEPDPVDMITVSEYVEQQARAGCAAGQGGGSLQAPADAQAALEHAEQQGGLAQHAQTDELAEQAVLVGTGSG